METMYERVKRMTKEEMKTFIYMVYLCGNEEGKHSLCDTSKANGLYRKVQEIL